MKKLFTKKKTIGFIAIVLSAAILTTSIHFSSKDVMAKAGTFQGIKEVVRTTTDEKPFIMLEVMPGEMEFQYGVDGLGNPLKTKMKSGQLGFLVGGNEPASFTKLLSDFSSFDDRKNLVDKFIKEGDDEASLSSITLSGNGAPLRYSPYEEAYALTPAEIEMAVAEDKFWKMIEFSDDNHIDEASGYKAIKANTLSENGFGRLVKEVDPENGMPFTTEGIESFLDPSNPNFSVLGGFFNRNTGATGTALGSGDFDPAFTVADDFSGKYNVKFEPLADAAAGYRVTIARVLSNEEVASGIMKDKDGVEHSLSGNYIYQCMNADTGDYNCIGKYGVDDLSEYGMALGTVGVDEDDDLSIEDDTDDGEINEASEEDNEIEVIIDDQEDNSANDQTDDNQTTDEQSEDSDSIEVNDENQTNEEQTSEEQTNEEENNDNNVDVAVANVHKRLLDVLMSEKVENVEKKAVQDEQTDDSKEDTDENSDKNKDEINKDEQENVEDKEDTTVNNTEVKDETESTNDDNSSEDEAIDEENEVSDLVEIEQDIIKRDEIEFARADDGSGDSEFYLLSFEYNDYYDPAIIHYSVLDWSVVDAIDKVPAYAYNAATMQLEDTTEIYVGAYPNYANLGFLDSISDTGFRFRAAVDEGLKYGNYELEKIDGLLDKLKLYNVPVYYTGGYINNEWFKKYIFDNDFDEKGNLIEDMNIVVNSLTPRDAGDYSEPAALGLLYLSAGTNRFVPKYNGEKPETPKYGSGNDITVTWMRAVIEAVLDDNLPVIIDSDLILNDDEFGGTNMQILAKILHMQDVAAFYDKIKSDNNDAFLRNANNALKDLGKDNSNWFNKDKGSHHVNKSVYVYNLDQLLVNKGMLDNDSEFGNDKNPCFKEIWDQIDSENEYLQIEGVSDDELIERRVNEAVAIKYIISFAARRSTNIKAELKVLEIEPCTIPTKDGLNFSGNKIYDGISGLVENLSEGHLYVVADNCNNDGNITVDDGPFSLYRRNKVGYDKDHPERCGTPILEGSKYPIILERMSTNELDGYAEDINSVYDLVYVGLNTKFFHEDSSGRTLYNDTDMNGLVYSNIGDLTITRFDHSGLMNRDYPDNNPNYNGVVMNWGYGGYGSQKYAGANRYSGNDITSHKANELLDFLHAGYPIIVDYNCYYGSDANNDVYDKDSDGKNGYIDNCSNMFTFLNKAANGYTRETYDINGNKKTDKVSGLGININNLFRLNSSNTLDEAKLARLQQYLALPKPVVNIVGLANIDEAQNVYDGELMKYRFEILDKRATEGDFTYTVHLFIDENCDGRFASTEEQEGFSMSSDSGSSVQSTKLKKGVTYTLNYKVPDNLDGALPWKLVVELNSNRSRRDYEIGCYKIHRAGESVINMLQLMPDNPGSGYWEIKGSTGGTSLGGIETVFEALPQYTLNPIIIRPGTNSNSSTDFLKEVIADRDNGINTLTKYDVSLLVLGFCKNYAILRDSDLTQYCNDTGKSLEEAMEDAKYAEQLIVKYIESGRSVLIGGGILNNSMVPKSAYNTVNMNTNKQTSAISQPYRGYYLSTVLRDLIGMDRYGITNPTISPTYKDMGGTETKSDGGLSDIIGDSKRAIVYKPNSADKNGDGGKVIGYPQGFSSALLDLHPAAERNKYTIASDAYIGGSGAKVVNKAGQTFTGFNAGQEEEMAASSGRFKLINKGIISLFPYALEDEINKNYSIVSQYSLDLDSISLEDKEQEVMVWYTYTNGDGVAHNTPFSDDARDRYYLYTKNNITYVGTTNQPNSVGELHLMANTMIACVMAGKKNPTVEFVDNEINKKSINSVRIPYDSINLDDTIDDNAVQELYFRANSRNIDGYTLARFYYEVPAGDPTAIDLDGITVKEFTGDILSIVDAEHPELGAALETRRVADHTAGGNIVNYTGYNIKDMEVYKIAFKLKPLIENVQNRRIIVQAATFEEEATKDGETTYAINDATDALDLIRTELFTLD